MPADIQVVGAGSWGLALARLLANQGNRVAIYCREEDGPAQIQKTRRSPFYLTDIDIPEAVEVCKEVTPDVDMAILAVPSHAMRAVCRTFQFNQDTIRVSVAKGIENESLRRMSEVIAEAMPGGPVAALSGPTHAEEVARDLPASVVAASEDEAAALRVQEAFIGPTFRVYTSPDVLGVELGGSLKNVIAIAAGVCDGFQLGDNAKAALMTRGLAEIARLGSALGADPLTFSGLSGMGDLIVTCGSRHSRNRAVGEQIARGVPLDAIISSSRMVAEGVRTTRSAYALAQREGVDMPITEQIYRVLFEGRDAKDAADSLMLREGKPERH